jgi:hypothetical protein
MQFDDLVRLDSSNGDLAVSTPDSTGNVWNFTGNVSLACFSELVRGDRLASDFGACVSMAIDLFSLQGLKVDFWPPRLFLPWEEGGSGGESAMAAARLDGAPPGAAAHIDASHHHGDDGHHHHHQHDATIYPGEFAVFLFSLFFVCLLIGVCAPMETSLLDDAEPAARVRPEAPSPRDDKAGVPLLPNGPARRDGNAPRS